MDTVSFVFRFKWICLILGILLLVEYFHSAVFERGPLLLRGLGIQRFTWRSIESRFRVHPANFSKFLLVICVFFFILASLGKGTQLLAGALSANDFWLFEDMLRQMTRGAPFLTRFAPQDSGWVQHGAVHSFFSLYLVLPLVWILGPTFTALILGPLALSLAGGMLGLLSRARWGNLPALAITVLFLWSGAVGRILTYEVHPESMYPFFVFLWAWSIGWSDGRVRWAWLLFATAFGMGIKEDSFLVFFPLLAIHALTGPRSSRAASLPMAGLAIAIFFFHMHAIGEWSRGAWGPTLWESQTVKFPTASGGFEGHRWDSLKEIVGILAMVLDRVGGIIGALATLVGFLVSRPWWSLVILAPWVLVRPKFWIAILPLAAAHAWLGGLPAKLMLYYAAPFLGIIWLFATRLDCEKSAKSYAALTWLTAAALLLGSGGIEILIPSREFYNAKQQARELVRCLKGTPVRGMVPSPLIGAVPQENLWLYRIPSNVSDWERIEFALLAPSLGAYEFPRSAAESLTTQLTTDPDWVRWGIDCREAREKNPSDLVHLFVRKNRQTP